MDWLIITLFGWHLLFGHSGKLPIINLPITKSINVIAVGDINLGRVTGQKLLAGDVDFPFRDIADELKSADITFGNLESQLRDTGGVTQDPNNEYRFSGPTIGAQSLANAGFDIVSIANNHMWDYGINGFTQTIGALNNQTVAFAGASIEPNQPPQLKTFKQNGQIIGFLAITDLLNGYEKTAAPTYINTTNNPKLLQSINDARTKVDWLIVSLHMGVEYQTKPNQKQIDLARKLIDSGVDIVIGHHPHVRQTTELYKDKLIIYSLGNFAFWQPFSNETKTGTLLKLTLKPDHTFNYQTLAIQAGWQPKLVVK